MTSAMLAAKAGRADQLKVRPFPFYALGLAGFDGGGGAGQIPPRPGPLPTHFILGLFWLLILWDFPTLLDIQILNAYMDGNAVAFKNHQGRDFEAEEFDPNVYEKPRSDTKIK
jgi:hypothetical protein